MAACAVSPNLAKEAGATTAAPVVTCRKIRPKVSLDLWCRSCAMNLKKRCGGLLSSPEAPPQPVNSSSICSSGFSGDAFVIDGCPPPKTTSMLIESKNIICNPRGDGGGSSTNNGLPGVPGRRRCAPSSSGWVTPSPQHSDAPLLQQQEVAPRHKRARTLSSKIAGHLKGQTCSRASEVENDADGASDGDSDGEIGDADTAAEAAAAAAAAAEETWVQCESCATWRQLPKHVNPDDLPDVWFCHMNEWNPAERFCMANGSARNAHSRRRCSAADAALVHKVLGVQSVEQVKALNKARGLRTTRVGTNGGRKSKSELIDDLLDDGLTPADIGAVAATTTSAASREASPTLQPHARNTNTNNRNGLGNGNFANKSNGNRNGGKGVANSGNGSRNGHRYGNTSEHGAKKSRRSLVPPHARSAPHDETGDIVNQPSEEGDGEEEQVRVQRRPRSNTCDDLPSPLSAPWPDQWPGHGRTDNHHEGPHPSSSSHVLGTHDEGGPWTTVGSSINKKRKSMMSSSGRRERADSWPASSSEATRHFESKLSGGSGPYSGSYISARGGGSARSGGSSGGGSSGGGSTAHVEALSERRLTADAVADAERFRAYVRSRIQQTPSPVLTSSSSSLAHSPSMAAPSSTTTIEAPGASSSSSSFTSTLSFEHGGAAAAAVHSTARGGAHLVYTTPEAASSTSSASDSEATAASSSSSSCSLVSCCPLASLAEVACIALEYPNHTTTSSADAPSTPCPAKISSDLSTPSSSSSFLSSSFSSPPSSSSASTAAVLSAPDAVPASSSTTSLSSRAAAPSVGILTPAPLPAVALPRATPVPLSGAATRALTAGSTRLKATTAVEESSAEEFINGAKASSNSGPKDSAEAAATSATSSVVSAARIMSVASGASFNAPTEVASRSPQPMALDECLAMVDRNSKQRAAAASSALGGIGGRSSKDSSDGSEEYDKDNVLLISEDQSTSGNEDMACT